MLIDRLEKTLEGLDFSWELVLVDDGSRDASVAVAQRELRGRPKLQAKLISLSRNFGKEAALTAGLQATQGDVVIPLDADLQDPPELIAEMVERWREGYDVVYGIRRRRQSDSLAKRCTAFVFYRLMGLLSNIEIPADTGDFRLMDRAVVDAIAQLPERSRFMKGLFAWVGFNRTSITYDREDRSGGKSQWSYWKLWNFALDGITSFSRAPLQVWSYAGVSIALLALIYGGWMIIRTLLFGVELPGYASLITAVLFLGGIQLIGLGILGEYLGRIFEEVKGRPLYLIRMSWRQEGKSNISRQDSELENRWA